MFSNSFSFKGRIRRTEYGRSIIILFWFVFLVLIFSQELMYLLLIPGFWFSFAQGAKRCHDLGNSGWWQLIPFYTPWLLFQDGQPGSNEYGENPKGTQGIQGTGSFSLDKDDKNLKVLANRKFQNQVLFNISRITWTFNENGSKVNVKATWFAVINIVNSTANVESLGEGKFVGKGFVSQKFSLEGNRIFLPDGTSLGEVF